MASGSSSAQEKKRRPGNSHTAVSQARETPRAALPAATPSASQKVLTSSSARVVSTRCRHTSPAGARKEDITTATGSSTAAATAKGATRHPPPESRRRRRGARTGGLAVASAITPSGVYHL